MVRVIQARLLTSKIQPRRCEKISTTILNQCRRSSASRLEESPSHSDARYPFASSSSSAHLQSSVEGNRSRLRKRAGSPVFDNSDKQIDRVPQGSREDPEEEMDHQTQHQFRPMKPWSMRARTQRERTQMNHRERSIALELLEDLAIPLEELQNCSSLSSSTDRDPGPKTSDSSINDLLIRPEFQSILSSNHPKTLTRHRPNRLSPEDIRIEDILKELTDSQIRQIDRLGNDVELLNWIDRRVFSQPSPSTLESSTEPTPSSNDILRDELGQAFKSLDSDQALAALESKLNHKPCDPRTILDQPLCFTPLFSPILAHLLQIVPNRYMNPHLALYLFDWVRSHQHPLVKYFGLTRDVYLENLRIKWYAFRDVRGIKLDLLEMKSIGLGFDERFGKLIQAVTHAVLEDEVKAENRHSQWTKSDRHRSESLVDDDLDRFRKISTLERFHVSQIESILQDHIDSQNQAFSRRLRVPDHSNPTPV